MLQFVTFIKPLLNDKNITVHARYSVDGWDGDRITIL